MEKFRPGVSQVVLHAADTALKALRFIVNKVDDDELETKCKEMIEYLRKRFLLA